jgi:hypothetical protein
MLMPEQGRVQKIRPSEEPGHQQAGDAAGDGRKSEKANFIAPDEPADMRGKLAKYRNRALLGVRRLSFYGSYPRLGKLAFLRRFAPREQLSGAKDWA